jgi:hypothetical protein
MKEALKTQSGERTRFQYTFDAENLQDIIGTQEDFVCPNCSHWESKTRELIWGYEELANSR